MQECQVCYEEECSKNNDLYVCKSCMWDDDDPKMINKTAVKQLYALTDKDMEKLGKALVKNSRNRSNPIQLFIKSQCYDLALAKYGSEYKLQERLRKREERGAKIRKTASIKREIERKNKAKAKADRLLELRQYLNNHNLNYRNDSQLCKMYIEQGPYAISLDEIVETMLEMQFFFNYTNYRIELPKVRQQYRQFNGRYYNNTDEEIVRCETKERMLIEYIEKNKTNIDDAMQRIPESLHETVQEYLENQRKKAEKKKRQLEYREQNKEKFEKKEAERPKKSSKAG